MPLFPLGKVMLAPRIHQVLDRDEIRKALRYHRSGDFGTVTSEDKKNNNHAIDHGGQVVSRYIIRGHIHVWIITEGDRSTTTVLLSMLK